MRKLSGSCVWWNWHWRMLRLMGRNAITGYGYLIFLDCFPVDVHLVCHSHLNLFILFNTLSQIFPKLFDVVLQSMVLTQQLCIFSFQFLYLILKLLVFSLIFFAHLVLMFYQLIFQYFIILIPYLFFESIQALPKLCFSFRFTLIILGRSK